MSDKKNILFVCYGNICRSTMCEGVFRSLVRGPPYAGLIGRVDSAGTASYHIGDDPDDRTMATLKAHGIKDYRHKGRKVKASDFDTFDYIFAMDGENLSTLRRLQRNSPNSKATVKLFGEYAGAGRAEAIEDPYYGGAGGFEKAYEQAVRFSGNFLKAVFPDAEASGQGAGWSMRIGFDPEGREVSGREGWTSLGASDGSRGDEAA